MAATEISANSKGSSSVKKAMTIEEQVQKNKRDFLKIMAATLKYQNPDKPADTSQVAQTMAIIHQTEETGKMRAGIDKLRDALTSNKLSKAMPFQGKIVKYDTSVKNFDGSNPVEFAYQLKYDDKSKPNGLHISTILSIYDSKNVKLFQTRGKTEKGAHSYSWDGCDDTGGAVPEGEYKLKVEAFFEGYQNGNYVKIPIEAGCFISGFVEAVEMQGDDVALLIDGRYIDLDDIIKVESEKPKEVKPQLSDYASYIGKEIVLDDNIISVSEEGKTSLSYNCNIDRPGNLMVKIYDKEDQYVGMAICNGIKNGNNHVRFVASKSLTEKQFAEFEAGNSEIEILAPGDYKYKLFLQDLLSSNPSKYNEISTSKTATVTGLDFSEDAYIVAGNDRYKISAINKLKESQKATSAIDRGVHYLGRPAIVNLDKMKISTNQAEEVQYVSIPPCEDGAYYGKVFMKIFDNIGTLISEIGTNLFIEDNKNLSLNSDEYLRYIRDEDIESLKNERAIEIPTNDFESIKNYVISLSREGLFNDIIREVKTRVDEGIYKLDSEKYAKIKALEVGVNFEILSNDEKEIFKKMIIDGQNRTAFVWDCKDLTGKKVKAGEYRYEFEIEKYHKNNSASSVLEMVKIEDKAKFVITEYRVEDGDLRFLGRLLNEDNSLSRSLTEFGMDNVLMLEA